MRSTVVGLLLSVVLWVFPIAVDASDDKCSLCLNGETAAALVGGDRPLSIPALPFVTSCSSLVRFLPLFAADSYNCDLVQSISTLCGCPIPQNEKTCFFCGSHAITKTDTLLPNLKDLFGFVPSCELAQAYFHVHATEQDCRAAHQEFNIPQLCGCPSNSNVFDRTT